MDFLEHAVETEVSTTECSFNAEIFLLNSQKKYFLTNVELYLPKIIFWFCPVYAVQLGVRFTLQALTGIDEKQHMEMIIVKNSHIYRFFIRLWKILLSIYRDGGERNEGSLENNY